MNLGEEIIQQINNKKDIIFEIFMVICFVVIIFLVFSKINPTGDDIQNYDDLLKNNLDGYNSEITKVSDDSKKRLDSNQLNVMSKYKDLLKGEVYKEREANPFQQSF